MTRVWTSTGPESKPRYWRRGGTMRIAAGLTERPCSTLAGRPGGGLPSAWSYTVWKSSSGVEKFWVSVRWTSRSPRR